MECVTSYVEGRHFRIGNLYPFGIGVGIEFALNFEASVRPRVGDQLDHGEAVGERRSAPVLRDVAEHAMLDLVPLRGPRRIVADLDDQAGFVGGCWSANFQSRRREPLEPPPSAVIISRFIPG